MYERFTDRARKVMNIAKEEAKRFSHDYVGTETLLLGLCKESGGIASKILTNYVTLSTIQLEVEKIIPNGFVYNKDEISTNQIPLSPSVKKIIEHAVEESRNLNHNYVGTEHLLLGFLKEKSASTMILENFGINSEVIRKDILNLFGVINEDPTAIHTWKKDRRHERILKMLEECAKLVKEI